jgi:L-lactate utilization protein LutC
VAETAMPPHLDEAAVAEFSQVSSPERMAAVALALERNGIRALLAQSGEEARQIVASLIPPDAEVFNNTSRTLEHTGIADDIERSGRYEPLRVRLFQMDREMQAREMRILGASPDYVIGSVHAVTEAGSLVVASASGSQLGPIASGAEHVIFVIGGQKIVADLESAIRRIYQYSFPLEDRRAREAYGVPSGVNNILIINDSVSPDRITAVLVDEELGF